jgi:hypothetical protein
MPQRLFDTLSQDQKEMYLFCCTYLSHRDVVAGICQSSGQEARAISYGDRFGVTATDFASFDTVFPSNGDPQPPK